MRLAIAFASSTGRQATAGRIVLLRAPLRVERAPAYAPQPVLELRQPGVERQARGAGHVLHAYRGPARQADLESAADARTALGPVLIREHGAGRCRLDRQRRQHTRQPGRRTRADRSTGAATSEPSRLNVQPHAEMDTQ